MRFLMILIFILSSTGCQAQLQKWQRERTVEHLSRLKSYQGHLSSVVAGETSEMDIWFESPNRFLVTLKNGDVVRSDGSTMEIYDSKTRLHSVFKNMPSVTQSEGQQLIRDLFDQSMSVFTFALGPLGKVAGRQVIELRSKSKGSSIVQSAESQIFDEFSFPLKSLVKFKDGQTAQYEFTQIDFNEKIELPKAKIPKEVLKVEWDFHSVSAPEKGKSESFQNLKLEKTLKHEAGMVLDYYRNGAQYLSVIRYKNLGMPPAKKGVPVKIGKRNGFLMPGLVSNTLSVSIEGETSVYSSNLLIDDLIEFALQ